MRRNHVKVILVFFGVMISLSPFAQSKYDTNSVMVRFNHTLLDLYEVDNWDDAYFQLEKMFSEEGISELAKIDQSRFNINQLECRKIFHNLKSSDTVSIGRQGHKVSIPPFWATFSVTKPDNVDFLTFTRTLACISYCDLC